METFKEMKAMANENLSKIGGGFRPNFGIQEGDMFKQQNNGWANIANSLSSQKHQKFESFVMANQLRRQLKTAILTYDHLDFILKKDQIFKSFVTDRVKDLIRLHRLRVGTPEYEVLTSIDALQLKQEIKEEQKNNSGIPKKEKYKRSGIPKEKFSKMLDSLQSFIHNDRTLKSDIETIKYLHKKSMLDTKIPLPQLSRASAFSTSSKHKSRHDRDFASVSPTIQRESMLDPPSNKQDSR